MSLIGVEEKIRIQEYNFPKTMRFFVERKRENSSSVCSSFIEGYQFQVALKGKTSSAPHALACVFPHWVKAILYQ